MWPPIDPISAFITLSVIFIFNHLRIRTLILLQTQTLFIDFGQNSAGARIATSMPPGKTGTHFEDASKQTRQPYGAVSARLPNVCRCGQVRVLLGKA